MLTKKQQKNSPATANVDLDKIRKAAPEFTACRGKITEVLVKLPEVRERGRLARSAQRLASEERLRTMEEVVRGQTDRLPAYAQDKERCEDATAAKEQAEQELKEILAVLTQEQERLDGMRGEAFQAIGSEGRRQHIPIVQRMAEVLVELAELEQLETAIYEAVDVTQLLPSNPLSSRPDAYLTPMGITRLGSIDDPNSSVGCWFRCAKENNYDVEDILVQKRGKDGKRKTESRSR